MSSQKLQHVAIIMDGNNRWARKNGKAGTEGHVAGVERIRDVLEACKKHQIEVLTLFAFSSENWLRPADEVDALMGLFFSYLKKEAVELRERGIRLRVIGRRDRFSDKLLAAITEAESIACSGDQCLNIAADYGGQWDIQQAAQQLAIKVAKGELAPEQIDEAALSGCLTTADQPNPDLIIRTSGEQRISNYLLWQAAYSELYFTSVLWPDFDGAELDKAVEDFYSRQRRFGKTAEQISRGQ